MGAKIITNQKLDPNDTGMGAKANCKGTPVTVYGPAIFKWNGGGKTNSLDLPEAVNVVDVDWGTRFFILPNPPEGFVFTSETFTGVAKGEPVNVTMSYSNQQLKEKDVDLVEKLKNESVDPFESRVDAFISKTEGVLNRLDQWLSDQKY